MTEFSLGYLMGIIVGEGSFTVGPRLSVKLHHEDPAPLIALQSRFGGKIYGPYKITLQSGRPSAFISWDLTGQRLWESLPVFDEHLPVSKKRVQYEAWRIRHQQRFAYHALRAGRIVEEVRVAAVRERRRASEHPSKDVKELRRLARRSRKGMINGYSIV